VEQYGSLINLSQEGQIAFKSLLETHLKRIVWTDAGAPIRLFPFTRITEHPTGDEPRSVVIDPAVSFGRPVLVGTGIPTSVVADRYKAGESIADLSRDYGRSPAEIEEAIRCELRLQAA